MESTDAPAIIEHINQSMTFTAYDVRWVPCSARFVVMGLFPRGTGVLQVRCASNAPPSHWRPRAAPRPPQRRLRINTVFYNRLSRDTRWNDFVVSSERPRCRVSLEPCHVGQRRRPPASPKCGFRCGFRRRSHAPLAYCD